MKPRMLVLMSAITLIAALATPARSAALEPQQEADGVSNAGTATANPVPLINQPLVPDAVKPGGRAFVLTVNGMGFVPGSVVKWNGSSLPTTFVSGSPLKASVPASYVAQPGTASVTVVNPSPGGGTSNVVYFPITEPSSAVSFNTSTYSVGMGTGQFAVGDFNGDGKLDLAVTNRLDNTVSILTGNGDGTFKELGTVATGQGPQGIVAADFNGDGKLDLAIANNGSGTVSILLGKGDGTFEMRKDYTTGLSAQTVAVGDFDGDGMLDLAVANAGPSGQNSTVSILLGNGDGTFQPQVGYPAGVNPEGVLVGDFNRDGKLDLAVLNNNPPWGISILLGNGDGTFGNPVLYISGTNSRVGIVADFNSDGKLDLAVANYTDNDVSILFGNGDGSFQAPVNYPVGGSPQALRGADLNGDGKLDLVTANVAGNSVSVLLGNGDGTFQAHTDYPTGPVAVDVAVADFNADGRLDLAVADNGDAMVSVLLQSSVLLSQTVLSFADQVATTSSPPQNVTLTNLGPQALAINSIAIAGADPNDFSQTNTCGSSVPPQGSCTVTVTFRPTQVGTRTASVTITDNAAGSPQSIALSGTGLSPVLLSRTAINFASQVVGTSSAPQAVTLTNIGGEALSIGSIAVTGTNGSDFSQTHTCGSSLAAGASCMISVTFKPTQIGPRTAALTITDSAADSLQIALSGTGLSPVSLSKTALDFAAHVVGTTSAPQTVTLSNIGPQPLTIGSIAVTGTDFIQTHTCGSSLAGGASCMISVTFKPTQVGPRTAALTITDNAADSLQVALSGTGVLSGPNATLSLTSLTFPTQLVGTASPAQSVTLTNWGTVTLSVSFTITGTDRADFHQVNTCGSSVAPGATCTISLAFEPTGINTRSASLSITDNAPGSPQIISLSGTGTEVQLNPSSLIFPCVIPQLGTGCSAPSRTTTLTNNGTTSLSIASITGSTKFSQTNNCGTGVGAGASCTITVGFGSSTTGSFSGDITVTDNGGGSPQQVALSGIVTKARCTYHCKRAPSSSPAVQSALAARSTAFVPSPTGPSHVGTRVTDLLDSTREDPYVANGTKRELLVRFWYPASLDKGCSPAEYTTPALWNYFSQLTGVPFPVVKTNSCLDARIAEGSHPVVVFTHGYTGAFTDYTFIFEDLANRGYVVVSVDHSYEATAVEFPDGRFVESVVGSHWDNSWRTDRQTLDFAVSVRLGDLRFVVDELERLNAESGSPFAGKLDLAHLAVGGHSLGGMTALPAVLEDTRFKAAILIDGWPDSLTTPTQTPVLILAAGHEQWSNGERDLWNNLRGARLAVNLRGTEHVTPSDLVWLAKGAVATGSMGTDRTVAAIRSYIAAFLDTYLRGQPMTPLLRGPSSEYPDAVVTTEKQSLRDEGVDQFPDARH